MLKLQFNLNPYNRSSERLDSSMPACLRTPCSIHSEEWRDNAKNQCANGYLLHSKPLIPERRNSRRLVKEIRNTCLNRDERVYEKEWNDAERVKA
jgi:hypothetical protein